MSAADKTKLDGLAAQPVRVASTALADPLTLPAGRDIIVPITGTNGGTAITNITAAPVGTRATLEFQSAGAYITTIGNIKLVQVYESTVLGMLTVVSDGTNWVEQARVPNRATNTMQPSPLSFGGGSSGGANTLPARSDHTHELPGLVAPNIKLGTAGAMGMINASTIPSDGTIAAFDTTAPTTQGYGDSADVGTAAFAARRDHKHAFPSDYRVPFLMMGG